MKYWLVKIECFWSADRIESIYIRANTKRKAEMFAIEKIKQLYPNINNMIRVVEVKMVE